MEGAARRAEREFKLAIIGAWHGEAFARTKRLEKLSAYTGDKPKPQRQSPDEMFAALLQTQAGGAPLNIRQIN